jgi:lysophospholipase L1-like esterase
MALVVALLAGCASDGPALLPTPAHASLFGDVDVTLRGDLDALGEITSVTIGDVDTYDLRRDGDALTVRLQGAPQAGDADVVVEGTRGRSRTGGVFHFDAPAAGVPLVWAAFGASLTQGVQSGGIDRHTQLHGAAALIARSAGVYLAVPLLADGLTPPLTPADFDADCTPRAGAGAGLTSVTDTLAGSDGVIDLRRGRIDWILPPRNHAIGRAKVEHILHGLTGGPVIISNIIERPTLDPDELLAGEVISQIERIEALDPDVALCTDLLANDLDPAVAEDDDVHPELNTDLDQVRPLLAEMMARLGRLHGQYFFANMPSPSLIANVSVLRARRLAAGDSAESFAGKLAVVDAQAADYDAALADAIAPYPNLHLVDFAGAVASRYASGVEVDGEPLTLAPFGGIFSLDHLHFSDVGYAIFANEIVPVLNAALGTSIEPIDLGAMHATDPYSPSTLRAAGLGCPAR